MAIGTPVERYAQSLTAQAATSAFSPASTIAAGTRAVLLATTGVSGIKQVSTVTDNAGGNTWAVDATSDNSDDGGFRACGVASCHLATQILTSNTITITWTVSTNNQCHIWVQEVSGLATTSAFDQTAVGSDITNSQTTAATATLAQADEIVFVVMRGTGDITGWTPGATYTNLTTATLGSTPLSGGEYKIVAATTAVSGAASWTTGGNSNSMLLVTYKGAASAATSLVQDPSRPTIYSL